MQTGTKEPTDSPPAVRQLDDDVHHNGVDHTFELFLLGLVRRLVVWHLRALRLLKPVQSFLDGFLDLIPVAQLELVLQLPLLQRVRRGEAIHHKAIARQPLRTLAARGWAAAPRSHLPRRCSQDPRQVSVRPKLEPKWLRGWF